MAERIEKKEFVRRLAERMSSDEASAEQWLGWCAGGDVPDLPLWLWAHFTRLRGLLSGRRRESTAFKFNPGQKLRALFGWSSTYRGPL